LLLKAFLTAAPHAHLAILVTTPPSPQASAYDSDMKCVDGPLECPIWERMAQERIYHRMVERLLQHFKSQNDLDMSRIHLVPTNVALDPLELTDTVHPNSLGYEQLGTSVYCWIKWWMSASHSSTNSVAPTAPTHAPTVAATAPTAVPTSPTPAPTSAAPGWYASDPNSDCNTACEAVGLACSSNTLSLHNSEVDTEEEVLALIEGFGESTDGLVGKCTDRNGDSTAVPNWKSGRCFLKHSNSAFDCAAAGNGGKQRLCYCHGDPITKPSDNNRRLFLSGGLHGDHLQ